MLLRLAFAADRRNISSARRNTPWGRPTTTRVTSAISLETAISQAPTGRSDNDQRHKFDLLGTFEAGKWFDFGTVLSLYSGKPVNITTGSDNNRDSLALDRPAGISRNSLHGPSYINLDLNLAHDVFLTKAGKKGPVATISINSFTYIGVISSPFFGHAVAAQPPRSMQINLQFKF